LHKASTLVKNLVLILNDLAFIFLVYRLRTPYLKPV